MMNKLIIFCAGLLLFFITACSTENEVLTPEPFTISGTIENADSALVKLQKRIDGEWVVEDSTVVFENTFDLEGKIALAEMFYLSVDQGRSYIRLFAEPGAEMVISANADSLNKADVQGSPTHLKYEAYNEGMEPFTKRIRALYPKYDLADSLEDKTMEAELDSIYDVIAAERDEYTKSVIYENLDNPLGPYLTTSTYYDDSKLDEMKSILDQFTPAVDSSRYTIRLKKMAAVWSKVAVGQPSIDFTQNDTTGTPVTLSDLQGKYVLIDFWASWCGPCRAENPNVVKLYNELHDKGFEIIGVSFDTKRDNWLEAIKQDSLTWYHVSDLNGWNNEVGKMYAVRAIPHTILLDKEGTIIAKNLRGAELRAKLEELLL
ncbi:MAG: AhpC/TSA family protein [Bacteroidetes bacterium]|nr:MAG: AhpC/TSA family protein [Bacteroidota bacterium]